MECNLHRTSIGSQNRIQHREQIWTSEFAANQEVCHFNFN